MRIISGKYGGRKLLTPKDDSIRPTIDKIRGSIFNILRGYGVIEDAKVLDIFCGTGALGLEALTQLGARLAGGGGLLECGGALFGGQVRQGHGRPNRVGRGPWTGPLRFLDS